MVSQIISQMVKIAQVTNLLGLSADPTVSQLQFVYTEGAPRHSVVNVLCTSKVIGGAGMTSKFEHILQACLDWLTSRSESAQLAEIGYGSSGGSMAVVVQQQRQLAAAHKAVRDGNPTDSSPFEALAKQLQKTGKVLSSFAGPGFCNNPACVNVSRTLEASLVCGHTTKCSSCRTARYCSRACQVTHWKQHKPVCKALAAAHAAKGGGA